jgi:hypothetical protein
MDPALAINAFYGTTEDGVKTQIWIARSVQVLVATLKKRLALNVSLYETPRNPERHACQEDAHVCSTPSSSAPISTRWRAATSWND